MIFSSLQPQNEISSQTADRVPPSLRRFGAGLVEQARLRAKFATAVAVASGAVAVAAPALAEDAKPLPSAAKSLFLITNSAKDPSGMQIAPGADLSEHIDPITECGPTCRIELRCPGGSVEGIVHQSRMEDGGVSVPVDKSRGLAGLATCPGDQSPSPFLIPGFIPLVPPSDSSPAAPESGSEVAAPAADADAADVSVSAAPPEPSPAAEAADVVVEKSEPPATQLALNAGIEVPLTSTHGFMRDPGVFVEGVSQSFESLAGARGVLRAAWNPIAMQSAGDDARFHPRNPDLRVRGNAVRATGGLVYPHEFARSGGFSLDAQAGVDAGLAVLGVPRRRDAGVDKDGYLADIPGSDTITAVVEGHGGLTAHFGERLRLALGLRHGQSPFAVQTKAGARAKAHANFTSVNAGLGVQF